MEKELVSEKVKKSVEELARQGRAAILEGSTPEEIKEFRGSYYGLGLGEIDTMLACEKMRRRQGRAYCILGDSRARTHAARIGVPFTGVLGLLRLLRDRGIATADEIGEIVDDLRRSRFRVPEDVDI